ncbi:MAG: hypothetical protein WC575_05000 [Patescibacteria group bacterium]
MDAKSFFTGLKCPAQRRYEALKAFYIGGQNAAAVTEAFSFSPKYFRKICFSFIQSLQKKENPFFIIKKPGPQQRRTSPSIIQRIVMLRKQNYSITDIRACLHAEKKSISLDTIDQILKGEGFARLFKRTRQERLAIQFPQKWEVPRSKSLVIEDENFTTETGASPLLFLPLLEKLKIIEAIKSCGFPQTKDLSDVNMVLSFLALKLLGTKRWSHDSRWNADRALGFFAGLNVLPKATTLSTYSYRVSRKANRDLLLCLSRIFTEGETTDGEFNLDFKAIPHWGDDSVLEKNWAGSRSKAVKSLLALIAQDPITGNLAYTNAEIKHRNQNDAALEFVDFWREGRGVAPKMLIFDSKFTSYKNLSLLNQSKEGIKFLTLRRRGKNLMGHVAQIPLSKWQTVKLERSKGKSQTVSVYDGTTKLRHYDGEVREIILTNHGRLKPAFLITNDFTAGVKDLIEKYARRWLVEQEIAEQVIFFHLNHPSSSIVVKVDFDLTLTLLAHNLYKVLAKKLHGFEHCTVDTVSRKFLENGAAVTIKDDDVRIALKKKTHLPILLEVPWLKDVTRLSWMGVNLHFETHTVS